METVITAKSSRSAIPLEIEERSTGSLVTTNPLLVDVPTTYIRRLIPFDDDSHSLSVPNTHGDETVAVISSLHFAE